MTARSASMVDPAPPVLTGMSLLSFLDQQPEITWCIDGLGRCLWAGQRWSASTGISAPASRSLGWLGAVEHEDRPAVLSALVAAEQSGQFNVDFRLRCSQEGRHRWHRVRAVRLAAASDEAAEYLCIAIDIDELYHPQEHQARALAALQHRMRNTFGGVRSLIRRTAQVSTSVDLFAANLESRIGAIARVQASVIRTPVSGVDIAQLVADELAACAAVREGPAVVIDGPPLRLRPRVAETLALAVHELATNAIQHGALTSTLGKVRVGWWVERDRTLHFEWRETGLSPPPRSRRRGFGLEVLEIAMPYELKAETRLVFEPDSVCFRAQIPVAGNLMAELGEPAD